MFGLPILEVAIGLSFVYLLLALVCTTLNETLAGITGRRADVLLKGISCLIGDDPTLQTKFLAHPLIRSLAPNKSGTPSYLPASKFALALMDILTGEGKEASDREALRAGIKTIKSAALQTSLSTVLADSKQALATDQQRLEAWYDECMDRVSGWYKRRTTVWIWILAAIVTLVLDADSLQISNTLWTNQALRSAVIESAKHRAQGERPEELLPLAVHNDANSPKKAAAVSPHMLTKEEQTELGQLTGWSHDLEQRRKSECSLLWLILSHIPGWLITMIAVSLGAPFWFDTLNRFMNIRSAGRAPDEPRDKSSSPAKAST